MSHVRLQLPQLHRNQGHIYTNRTRFSVWACGRRFGKDVLQMNLIAETATAGYPVAMGAPTYKMLTDNWRAVTNLLQPVTKRRDASDHRLELVTGGTVDMWSLDNPDAIRGRKYKLFSTNEAGFVPDLVNAWNFVIRPTLIDLKGEAIFAGTPKGRNGFYQLYNQGADDQNEEWSAFKFTSYDNPRIARSEIEDMEAQLPERVARQEIHAEFLEDSGAVFRNVVACATAKGAQKGEQTVIGVDWGKHNDFTVITVLDTTGQMLAMDRFNQIDYAVQVGRLDSLCAKYNPGRIIAEANAMGEPIIEQLQRRDLPVEAFTTTQQSKAQIIESLALAFERSEIGILNDDVLINELQAFEVERLPAGRFRYQAPSGLHDDCVMSLALAWHGHVGAASSWMFYD